MSILIRAKRSFFWVSLVTILSTAPAPAWSGGTEDSILSGQEPPGGTVSAFLLAEASAEERRLLKAKPDAELAKSIADFRRFTENFPAPLAANEDGAKEYAKSVELFLTLALDRLKKGELLSDELKTRDVRALRDQHLITLAHFFELVVNLNRGAGGTALANDSKLTILRAVTNAANLVKDAVVD